MSMRSTRAYCTLLARRNTLRTICSSPPLEAIIYCNRKVRASVMALGDIARRCFVLPYSGLCYLWSPRSRKGHAYHAERNNNIPSQFERLVYDTPTYENPSRGLFYNGLKMS